MTQYAILIPSATVSPGYAIATQIRKHLGKVVATCEPELLNIVRRSSVYSSAYGVESSHFAWASGSHSNVSDPEELKYINRLISVCREEYLNAVIPVFDNDIYLLSKYKKELQKANLKCLIPDFILLLRATDKYLLPTYAAEIGFPTPQTFLCPEQNLIETAVQTLGFPLVLKARFSQGSRSVKLLHTQHDLNIALKKFALLKMIPVIQEYIHGEADRSIHYLIDKNGNLLSSFTLRKIRHISPSFSTAIEVVQLPTETDCGLNLVRSLGLTGLIVLTGRIEKSSGQLKILEINIRFGNNSRIWFSMPNTLFKSYLKILYNKDNANHALPPKIGSTGASPVEDLLSIFVLTQALIERMRGKLPKTLYLPSYSIFLLSMIRFYLQKPVPDVITLQFFRDSKYVLSYWLSVTVNIYLRRGEVHLRAQIPWKESLTEN